MEGGREEDVMVKAADKKKKAKIGDATAIASRTKHCIMCWAT